MNKLILKTVIAFICFFTSAISYSQSFYSIDQIENQSNLRQTNNFDFLRAKSLVTELHQKLYLKSDYEMNNSESATYYAETDVISYSQLARRQEAPTLEIITIKIKKTDNLNIDLASLKQDFRSLKYVHVICEFECDLNYIRRFFSNDDSSILIIYSISNPT
jgi:hypothetical protein